MRLLLFLLLVNAVYTGGAIGAGHFQWWHWLNVLAAAFCFAALWLGLSDRRSAA